MSTDQLGDDPTLETDKPDDDLAPDAEDLEDEKPPLSLDVSVGEKSACERHITVTINREDIDRYYEDAFTEMMPTASVPGFRSGRAPRKLVEGRFRKEVTDQVKGSLLMDSMGQISEDQNFTAIGEPEFDLEAVELPDDGPMTFEFDLEVRPEFDLPEWKGLTVKRPVKEFDDSDVDRKLEMLLTSHGQLEPHEGKARDGDYLNVNISSSHDGKEIISAREQLLRIRQVLSFRDGKIEGFVKQMKGVSAGEKRQFQMELADGAPNEELRGQKIQIDIEVLEVKRLELPKLTSEFLNEMGGFESESQLRDVVRKDLQRQVEYRQDQETRKQITAALVASADWELPPGLLRRQSDRELERAVLELRRNGFGEAEIRARENALRQNSAKSTAKALKEHFILERIAEEEKIDVDNNDYDMEIMLIASQSGESPRRVRAQLEKRGMMDVLRNQIVERKVVNLVREHAKFKDEPFELQDMDTHAIDLAAGGGDQVSEIPEAKESEATPTEKDEA